MNRRLSSGSLSLRRHCQAVVGQFDAGRQAGVDLFLVSVLKELVLHGGNGIFHFLVPLKE